MDTAPARWCAELARADADTLAAAFRDVADRMRPRTHGLLKIGCRREHAPAEGGERWFLHVGVVFEEASASEQFVEVTHGPLCREIQRAAELWTGAWATIHRHARGDAALRGYHKVSEGFVLPPPPARATATATKPVTSKSTSLAPTRAPAPPASTPTPVAPTVAPDTQRSLF